MAGQKTTRRQKDISRLLRDKKYCPPQRGKKNNPFSRKKLIEPHPSERMIYLFPCRISSPSFVILLAIFFLPRIPRTFKSV